MTTSLDSPEVVLFSVLLGGASLLGRWGLGIALVGVVLELLFTARADDDCVLASAAREALTRLRWRNVSGLGAGSFLVEAVGAIVEIDGVIGERILEIRRLAVDMDVVWAPVFPNELHLVVALAATHCYLHAVQVVVGDLGYEWHVSE